MSGERSCGAPGRLSEARGGRRVWSRVTMHTYATARANQGPGSMQSGAHAIGTAATRSLPRARAVRCAAAATDGQRWGWRRAPLQRTTRCARCWPRASPQPASSVWCCLTRPLWPARTGTACASCARVHRSSSAPAAACCSPQAVPASHHVEGYHALIRGSMRRHPLGGWREHVLDGWAGASPMLVPAPGHF